MITKPLTQKRKAESSAIKLLPMLVEAAFWNQKAAMSDVGEKIAAIVEATHPAISKRIRNTLDQNRKPAYLHNPDKLLEFEEARHGFDTVILPESIESDCRSIIQEHHRRGELAPFDLLPRHKILVYGPPGNGKTMLAEAFAFDLGVPFIRVKYGGLIGDYLGSTGRNIQEIMDYVRTGPCVLFLDEFDGIGMDRNDNQDVGEARRITNQLLISIERLPSTCILIAATNVDHLLDSALKRRFDFVLELPKPTEQLKRRCAEKELNPSITPGFNLLYLLDQIARAPFKNLKEVVDHCQRIRRDLVLNNGVGIEDINIRITDSGRLPMPQVVKSRYQRQCEIFDWACSTFGKEIATAPGERIRRFVEEALELAQAAGLCENDIVKLSDFVFSRPVGDIKQEVGQVGVTLLCYAQHIGINADEEENAEFNRLLSMDQLHFQARQNAKASLGIGAACVIELKL
ncbi:ATP-binding protein [Candidatus Methylospira mobilis]|uniref:AAA family ATPase n=1 Tax=Candidatus Methylospira mobilis TaxID=1808979 RepID=UPI0028EC5187|nr:ATP-binding protein [Candidatus Methylospira mobilis]WNV05823.1 ATP-binding protein [Candidatus Methylospira mobilis]